MFKIFTTRNITRLAVFSALSFALYWVKFPLPFIFPSFLDIQVSELPALLAGYMMGPVSGCIVILIRFLLKLPFTSTAYVGEFGDLILGILFVLPSSLIYRRYHSKKGAVVSLAVGAVCCTVGALFTNAFILIPFYCKAYGVDAVVGMLTALFPSITQETLMSYYLPLSVLPFNILRCSLVCLLTFVIYKRLERILDRIFPNQSKHLIDSEKKCIIKKMKTKSEQETFEFGKTFGKTLVGGEVVLLHGDLGAGKTVFTRGLAAGLDIKADITSPTFTLMNIYEGRLNLYHYDAYRLQNGEEAEERGLTEYFSDKGGVSVVEWPGNIKSVLPDNVIDIYINYDGEDQREIVINDK